MVSRFSALFAISGAALVVAACTASTDPTDESFATEALNGPGATRVHVMKMHPSSEGERVIQTDAPGPAGAALKYFGGPVLANVKVYAVYWGSHVQYQDHINAFYPAITNGAYFDWLSEYDTPTQHIGRGSFGGAVVDANPPSGTSVTDAQIQAEIGKLIDAGKLPPNDGNNLYMMYFPPGVKITGPQGAGSSCVEFCAYHGTFVRNKANAYYGVMPDLGGACSTGCGPGAAEDNITEVSSHELIEAVTDGAVGLATTDGPPLAWYDDTNGEIGDICNGTAAKVDGFTVQLEWSNNLKKCTSVGGGTGPTDGGTGDGGTTDGGTTSNTCSHELCSTGAKLTASCDPCVKKVCAADSYCCKTKWDSSCVSEVASLCKQTCH
jgi:hypothetical protein